jgi:hypothetical protein
MPSSGESVPWRITRVEEENQHRGYVWAPVPSRLNLIECKGSLVPQDAGSTVDHSSVSAFGRGLHALLGRVTLRTAFERPK